MHGLLSTLIWVIDSFWTYVTMLELNPQYEDPAQRPSELRQTACLA